MSLGMIGQKAGMTRIFDSTGVSIPVTVISFSPNTITQIKTDEKDGYQAVQVSYGKSSEKRVNKAISGHYKKSSLTPGRGLIEFRIENEDVNNFEIGKTINITTFKEGEHVDIIGTTKGKGFQGGVKRHHFKTQDATHGNSLSHRALGSTGQCQDPGRVFKGKKMPGQLGNIRNTIQNLVVVKIVEEDNIMLVKGSVPGFNGSNLIIKPTRKKYTPKKILTEEVEQKDESVEVKKSNQDDKIDDVNKKEMKEDTPKEEVKTDSKIEKDNIEKDVETDEQKPTNEPSKQK
jgi:large subunit ribosomal protein L3